MSGRKDAGTGATEQAGLDFSQLKADFERLSEGLGALRQHLVGLGVEGARGVQDAGLAQLDQVRRDLDDLSVQLRRQGRDALGEVERTVRERPLASLLMAFGAGMVLSRLFGRRH
jgi:ElaB/YqjD/DUF883 family membrane-anchored ribosome-binding protein